MKHCLPPRSFRLFLGSACVLLLLGLAGQSHATPESGQGESPRGYNRLVHESSPYLLLHRDNPIWWHAWGEAAFKAAREQDKPIFLSIGYSSCHWCHVMNGESFSNEEVAALLNRNFISILVDREERPDVDLAYARVLKTITGSAGWPMSIFLTPEGKVFMGASFIPRKQFKRMLGQFRDIWADDRGRIEEVGRQIAEKVRTDAVTGFSGASVPDRRLLTAAFTRLQAAFDPQFGGFGGGSKFLPPLKISLLLRIHARSGDGRALRMATVTLDAMARGGIHDHLGGGFHRYAVDREWRVPHFEKMLPENALLALAYLEAFQVTGNPEYGLVAKGIFDYVLRDLTSPAGGFHAAEDADSESAEGRFYVWTLTELKARLTGKEFRKVLETYHPVEAGNFTPWLKDVEENAGISVVKNANILLLGPEQKIPDGTDPILTRARRKLLAVRSGRTRPFRDEKIISAWNGLMIQALAKGYQVLGESRYLNSARRAARDVMARMRDSEGRLLRFASGAETQGARGGAGKRIARRGFLSDYAFLIQALLQLYQSDFDPRWITAAIELQRLQDRLFWDGEGGGYFFSEAGGSPLLQREKHYYDDAIPSGNAVAALNLLQLADLTLRREYRARAAGILAASAGAVSSGAVGANPAVHSQMLMALDYLLDRSKEIAVIGPPGDPAGREIVRYLHREFLPNKVLAIGREQKDDTQENPTPLLLALKPMLEGKTTTYVCEQNICLLPTTELAVVKRLVKKNKKYRLETSP